VASRYLKGISMAERYQQFLGSRPGLMVELVDQNSSPYRVRAEEGFEFFVSAEDFRNYYKKEGTPTPERWRHLITDPDSETVDCTRMAEVLAVVQTFVEAFQDYEKARSFVREAIRMLADDPTRDAGALRTRLAEAGWDTAEIEEQPLEALFVLSEDIRSLLLSDTCGVIQTTGLSLVPGNGGEGGPGSLGQIMPSEGGPDTARRAVGPQTRRAGMKNVEMTVDGDILTLTIDLSQEFGPSKSGKTIIVASTEGNKSVPGRDEKVGLNIYKEEGKKPAIGRKNSFKNVEMAVEGQMLTITVNLSQEFGPSKSGKTVIIGSTEGNQRVYTRAEKIGLNVYRKID
jgi:hypothetical protein